MIPVTYPSVYDSDGEQLAVVYFLADTTGKTKWVDYIPVAFQGTVASYRKNSHDNNGGQGLSVLTNVTGKQAWVDYIPVAHVRNTNSEDFVAVDPKMLLSLAKVKSSAAAAYSTRLVAPSYSGPLIRVRRSSDNAEADIGFNANGSLDEFALMNHVGAENLLTYSEQFDNAAWSKLGGVISTNTSLAPDGTTTADKITEDSTNGLHIAYRTYTLVAETEYTFAFYVKPAERTKVFIRADTKVGTKRSRVNLATQTVEDLAAGHTVTVTLEKNGFYRISASFNAGTGTHNSVFGCELSDGTNAVYVGDGASGAFLWGAQLNTGSTALDYCKTTSAPTTSGQNLLLHSQEFDNAAWTKFNASVTANQGTAPDGTVTMDQVAFSVTDGKVFQGGITTTPNTTYTYSVVLATASGTFNLKLWRTDGASWTGATVSNEITVTTTPTRYSLTFTTGSVAKSDVGFGDEDQTAYVLPATGSVLAWGAQINEGSTALPYKATTTAAVNNGSGFVTRVYEQAGVLNDEVFSPLDLTTGTATAAVSGRTATSFTTTGAGGVIFAGKMVVGRPYRVRIKGNTTANDFRFRNTTNLTGATNAATGDFDITADLVWSTNTDAYFFQDSAGTTTITEISVREKRDLIQNTAANQPRIVFAGTVDRLLVAENLLTHAGNFANPVWAAANMSKTVGQSDRLGDTTAALITEDTTNAAHYFQSDAVSVVSGTTYTTVFEAKAGAATIIQTFPVSGAFGTTSYANINLLTGEVKSFGSAVTTATAMGSGWYRVVMSVPCTTSSTSGRWFVGGTNNDINAARVPSYIGASRDFLVAFPQYNTGSAASPYVATKATAVKLGDRHPLNKPAIRTDGVQQSMATGSFTVAQPFTRASVLQFLNPAQSGTPVLLDRIDSTYLALYTTATNGHLRQLAGSTEFTVKQSIAVNERATVSEVFEGTLSQNSYNGSVVTGSTGTTALNGLRLGAAYPGNQNSSALFGDILIFPKSLGGTAKAITYGPELVSNGGFDSSLSGWSLPNGAHWTYSNGRAYHPYATAYTGLEQDLGLTSNKQYSLTVTVEVVSGTLQINQRSTVGGAAQTSFSTATSGTFTYRINGAYPVIAFGRGSSGFEGYIDNISVKEVQNELVSNGTFDTNTTGWTGTGSAVLSVSGGALKVENGSTVTGGTTQTITTVSGKLYEVSCDATQLSSTNAVFRTRNASTLAALATTTITATGRYVLRFIATSNDTQVQSINEANTLGAFHIIDNISVREVLPDDDRLNLEDDMKRYWGTP